MQELIQNELLSAFSATPLDVTALRLICAIVLGAILGWEREARDKPAGLRTHILISLAACLFTLIAFDLMDLPENDQDSLRTDPIRVIEAVTQGVAFLAAGSIITQGARVRGLTTGAGMWMAGAVGLACGTGNIPLASLATLLGLVVLWLLRKFARSDDDKVEERGPAER
ncbi:MgtC/SapB family protein [Roseivivax sp. CAU 1761]